MHRGMNLRKCNRLLFDGNTFQFHNAFPCEICEISFSSQKYRARCWNWEIQSRSVSAVPFLTGLMCDTICQVAQRRPFWTHTFHTFFMKQKMSHFLWKDKLHIFYEQQNVNAIHFVTAWASGTFPLTYTLKDMSVQQVFPFGTEIYSDKSLPIGCYS